MVVTQARRGCRGQSTAEYAIVIGLVIAAIVAMQVYVRRGINARVKDVTDNVSWGLKEGRAKDSTLGDLKQYEPYYAKSTYNVEQTRDATETVGEGYVVKKIGVVDETKRLKGGFTEQGTNLSADSAWKGNAGN